MKKIIAILLIVIIALTVLSTVGIAAAAPRHIMKPGHSRPHPPSRYHPCPARWKTVKWIWSHHYWLTVCVLRNHIVYE